MASQHELFMAMAMAIEEAKAGAASGEQTAAACMLMYEQGLIAHNPPIRSIGLSDAGQREPRKLASTLTD